MQDFLAGRRLSDDELEAHIADCGRHLIEAYERYEKSSCFTDLGDAQRWEMLQREAIQARSPARVAQMRQEQAERMAREPGATIGGLR